MQNLKSFAHRGYFVTINSNFLYNTPDASYTPVDNSSQYFTQVLESQNQPLTERTNRKRRHSEIYKKQTAWLGRVMRMDEKRTPKRVLEWKQNRQENQRKTKEKMD